MSRLTRFLLFAHGLTAAAHVVPTLALTAVLPWLWALGLGIALWALVALRLHQIAHDMPKPRWVTRLVDEPMFAHWGACLFGSFFLLLTLPAGLLGAALSPLAAGCYGAGLVVSGYSVWLRRRFVRVNQFSIELDGLPEVFDGYRVAQLSDLHIGSFDRRARGLEWAALANAAKPDLALVTGDLVTAGTAFYEDAAAVVGALEAKDGVLVSMGNHDQWDEPKLIAALEAHGVRVLANAWHPIERDGARIVVAGLADHYTSKDDLNAALADRPAGAVTLLMSHYPDFFARAAERGVELTLSGHTHGGQLGIPGLARRYNIASVTGKRSQGLFRRGASTLYVNAGLGTTGPPLRLGIAPEIAVITLRRRRGSSEQSSERLGNFVGAARKPADAGAGARTG